MKLHLTAFIFIFWSGTGVFGDHHKISPSVVLTKRGGTLLLKCGSENITDCKWATSYGYTINANQKSEPARILNDHCQLIVFYVMEMDEGKWQCSDSETGNITKIFDVVLESEDIPEIPYKHDGYPNDTVAKADGTVTFMFQFQHPVDSCVWNTPYGVIIPVSPINVNPDPSKFNTSFDKQLHSSCGLTVRGISDIDNGVWTCTTTAAVEDRNRVCEIGKVNITVAKAPENITIEPAEVFAVKDKVFLVSCIVKHSRPEPCKVMWYIESDPLKPTIVTQAVDIGIDGYVDYMETISMKGTQSVNGKTLRCVYDHIASHSGKDNEASVRVTVNELEISGGFIATVVGTATGGIIAGIVIGVTALMIIKKKCHLSEEDRRNLLNEDTDISA